MPFSTQITGFIGFAGLGVMLSPYFLFPALLIWLYWVLLALGLFIQI